MYLWWTIRFLQLKNAGSMPWKYIFRSSVTKWPGFHNQFHKKINVMIHDNFAMVKNFVTLVIFMDSGLNYTGNIVCI